MDAGNTPATITCALTAAAVSTVEMNSNVFFMFFDLMDVKLIHY
jgi:hypothetical protein